jgi:hypothetical protein
MRLSTGSRRYNLEPARIHYVLSTRSWPVYIFCFVSSSASDINVFFRAPFFRFRRWISIQYVKPHGNLSWALTSIDNIDISIVIVFFVWIPTVGQSTCGIFLAVNRKVFENAIHIFILCLLKRLLPLCPNPLQFRNIFTILNCQRTSWRGRVVAILFVFLARSLDSGQESIKAVTSNARDSNSLRREP